MNFKFISVPLMVLSLFMTSAAMTTAGLFILTDRTFQLRNHRLKNTTHLLEYCSPLSKDV